MERECKLCNKKYKSYKSWWNHNKKFHDTIENYEKMITDLPINTDNKNVSQDTCKYCKKKLANRHSKWRHEQKCNASNRIEQLELAVAKLTDMLNNTKTHSKVIHKNNKQLNTNTNSNNNINNNTINSNNTMNSNNTINIIKFGSENISEILSKNEIMKIFDSRYLVLEESIKAIHFNKKRPEMKNIYITNLRDDIAHVYNGNNFEAVPKFNILNELINNHLENIELSLENYRDKVPPKTLEVLDKFINKIQDEETIMVDEENNKVYKNYKSYKINKIKLMIYNESGKHKKIFNVIYDKKQK